jgi:hypothetical protein
MQPDEDLTTRDLVGRADDAPAERAERDADPPAEPEHEDREERFQREPATATTEVDEAGSLLPEGEEADFQRRWEEIQTRFVDDPRQAVEDADALVAGVMKRLAEGFAQARDGLEAQWSRGEDVGTEDLRVALQRYRGFFRRLLQA